MNKSWSRLLVTTLVVVALTMPGPRFAHAGGWFNRNCSSRHSLQCTGRCGGRLFYLG
jgi:hypothetical protein